MSKPLESSPSDRSPLSDHDLNPMNSPSLAEGLAALKQKDYERAIAHLEGICQTPLDPTSRVKAEMGLVKAYEQTGQVQRAIAFCRLLAEHSSRSVRQWALQTLEGLSQKTTESPAAPPPPSPSRPIAVAATEATAPASDNLLSDAPVPDATGFTPLNQFQPSSADDQTGFVPLAPSSASAPRPRVKLENRSGGKNSNPVPPVSPPVNPDIAPPYETPSNDEPSSNVAELANPAQDVSTPLPPTTPAPPAPEQSAQSAPAANSVEWKQAGRAKTWGSLGKMDITQLWVVGAVTAIALIYLLRAMVQVAFHGFSQIVLRLTWLRMSQFAIYADPFWGIVLGLAVLFFLSPWLFDRLFRSVYGAKALSWELLGRYSPESVSMLKRVFGQAKLPLPNLSILYTSAPLVLSYGYLPRHARIVLSQGLLDQLSNDEIASILAGETSHILNRNFAVLSWLTLVAQIPYLVYWNVSAWGDRVQNQGLQGIAVGVSALSYGIYGFIHGVGLWLSRVRLYYSDHTACEITGNPNGLSRALLKLAQGNAKDIQRQGQTAPLVESFDLLTPVGYKTILTLGSTLNQVPIEHLLTWDHQNPYRRWLAIPQAHPPLGDRLQHLTRYARYWHLEPELNLPTKLPTALTRPLKRPKAFWLQIAPWAGVATGAGIAVGLWILGSMAYALRWHLFSWMRQDWSLFWGLSCIGFSIGMFLRINPFFPDIKRSTTQIDPALSPWLTDPTLLPLDSQPVRLQGKLLGRRGLGNILAQDLILASPTGLIKLHCESPMGAVGHLVPEALRPLDLLNRSVWVNGWLRRGVEPCLDVEAIQVQSKSLRGGHPLWSTGLAMLAALLGAYIIMRGGG